MIKNYIQTYKDQGGTFYEDFEKDMKKLKRLERMRYLGLAGGVFLAATVFNPNFTSRRSWYVRKFSLVFWGAAGFNLVNT